MQNNIEIVFTLDKNYIKPLSATIASILKNAKETSFLIFNIVHTGIDLKNQKKIEQLKTINQNCEFNFVDFEKLDLSKDAEKYIDKREDNFYISPAANYRLYLPELFKDKNKILYLDTDLIIFDDLYDLYSQDCENVYACVIQDKVVTQEYFKNSHCDGFNCTFQEYFKNKLNKHDSNYFSSGVILYNLEKQRQDNITSKIFDFLLNNFPLKYVDQDALNVVWQDKVYFCDTKWNVEADMFEDVKNTAILHYIGALKPWNAIKDKPCWDFWWEYFQLTPFYSKQDEKNYNFLKQKHEFRLKIKNMEILSVIQTPQTLHIKLGKLKTRIKINKLKINS